MIKLPDNYFSAMNNSYFTMSISDVWWRQFLFTKLLINFINYFFSNWSIFSVEYQYCTYQESGKTNSRLLSHLRTWRPLQPIFSLHSNKNISESFKYFLNTIFFFFIEKKNKKNSKSERFFKQNVFQTKKHLESWRERDYLTRYLPVSQMLPKTQKNIQIIKNI